MSNSPPVAKTTVIADTIANLYGQFQNAPVMTGIVASYAVQAQELETLFVNLIILRALPNAENAQLDVLGKIVGEERQGRTDDEYRIGIGARIKGNKANGSIEDIIAVLLAADSNLELDIRDPGYASLVVRLVDDTTAMAAEEVDAILQRIKGGGVRADLIYSLVTDANTLSFSSSDVAETDVNAGLGNDAGTTGGEFADIWSV
jgi:hypothetical protein